MISSLVSNQGLPQMRIDPVELLRTGKFFSVSSWAWSRTVIAFGIVSVD